MNFAKAIGYIGFMLGGVMFIIPAISVGLAIDGIVILPQAAIDLSPFTMGMSAVPLFVGTAFYVEGKKMNAKASRAPPTSEDAGIRMEDTL
jgi:hypothetical protein